MIHPVYVDMPFKAEAQGAQAHRVGARHGHQWCHMWCRDVEALHAMARKLAMKRDWFQNKLNFPHYDLVPTKRQQALSLGAVEVDLAQWMRDNTLQLGRIDLQGEHVSKPFNNIRWEHFKPESHAKALEAWKVSFYDEQAEDWNHFKAEGSRFWILPAVQEVLLAEGGAQ